MVPPNLLILYCVLVLSFTNIILNFISALLPVGVGTVNSGCQASELPVEELSIEINDAPPTISVISTIASKIPAVPPKPETFATFSKRYLAPNVPEPEPVPET